MSCADYLQFLISGLTIGCIYSLLALGFHIVHEGTDIFNFAYGEIFVLGGLIAFTLTENLSFNLPAAFMLIMIFAFAFGVLFEKLLIRPLMAASHLLVIISTLAAGIIIENSYYLIWQKDYMYFPPFIDAAPIRLFDVNIPLQNCFVFGLVGVTVLAVFVFFRHTYVGKAMRGAANNKEAARAVGINPIRMVSYAFGVSFVIGMVGGVVVGPITYVGGSSGPLWTVKGFVAALLGGISSPVAVILGGLVLGTFESFVAGLVTSSYRDVIALGVLLAIYLFKPTGIFVGGHK